MACVQMADGQQFFSIQEKRCVLWEREMLSAEQKYRAYQLLRELDKTTSSLMNRVAYNYVEKLSLEAELRSQRQAFDEWVDFIKSISHDL